MGRTSQSLERAPVIFGHGHTEPARRSLRNRIGARFQGTRAEAQPPSAKPSANQRVLRAPRRREPSPERRRRSQAPNSARCPQSGAARPPTAGDALRCGQPHDPTSLRGPNRRHRSRVERAPPSLANRPLGARPRIAAEARSFPASAHRCSSTCSTQPQSLRPARPATQR